MTREDEDVRTAHAARHGDVSDWTDAPNGGHPGAEPNCRCVARPVRPNQRDNVVLAQVADPAGAFLTDPISIPPVIRNLPRVIVRRLPAVALVLGGQELGRVLANLRDNRRFNRDRDRGAEALGLDTESEAGRMASIAYALTYQIEREGVLGNQELTPDQVEIVAQAFALLELSQPGTTANVWAGDAAAIDSFARFARGAVTALEEGRLRLRDGDLADGWVEIFPQLSDDERRLGDLPGFTPERSEEFRETFPAETVGLPDSTGAPVPADPTGNIVSTPIPEEDGPNIVEMPRPGEPTAINPSDDEATQRGHRRENESAQILGQNGFEVIQNPVVNGPKNPDYLINGETYDHYAPSTDHPRRIWERVQGKVENGQASNIVIGLQDSNVEEDALRQQFEDWSIEGLGDVIIIRPYGTIGRL